MTSTALDDAPPTDVVGDAAVAGPDFLVNTTLFGNQFLTNHVESAGLQLATANGDVWTAAFRDECTSCVIHGRRFDGTGAPVPSGSAQGIEQFAISSQPTTSVAIPAVAGSFETTLAVWNFVDPTTLEQGVACRAFSASGQTVGPGQPTLAAEPADVVGVTALTGGNFVVTWRTYTTETVIRGAIVKPDCSLLAGPFTVSTVAGTDGPRSAHVAGSGSYVLYVWTVDGDVHIRSGSNTGALGAERILVYQAAYERIDYVRIVPWGSEFALAVRWAATNMFGNGRIEVYRLNYLGQLATDPILVTINSRADPASNQSFGMAQRSDRTLLVVWQACPSGPGSCDVFGRFVGSTEEVLGTDEIVVPTTTGGDQMGPSAVALASSFVVAWTDGSATTPDDSGSAVRARIIRPSP